jgi:replicative DNA helicase
MINKVPPNSLEAEMAVLGAMLIERDALESAIGTIEGRHFYSDRNRGIFETMRDMNLHGMPVDLVTLQEELKKNGRLESLGGTRYLAELMEKVTTAAHTQAYVRIVKDKAQLRELIRVGTDMIEKAYEASDDVKNIIDTAEARVLSVAHTSELQGFCKPSELAETTVSKMESFLSQHSNITGVPTGFTRLDDMTGGFQKSEMIILAARPSMGKTALALNIAYNACVENKVPVAFFSMEMNRFSIMQRLICSAARVNWRGARRGTFQREMWGKITRAASKISESDLYIDDSTSLTILDIRNRSRKLMTELKSRGKRLGMVMLDYLQLVRPAVKSESRQQDVAEISRLLKDLARSLEIPVVALSQLNRKSEDKNRSGNRPQLSDLRDSGSIEQDADVVGLIHREEYYNRSDPSLAGKATLIIAKQRNGPVGDVDLTFISDCTRFENPAPAMEVTMAPEPGEEAVY